MYERADLSSAYEGATRYADLREWGPVEVRPQRLTANFHRELLFPISIGFGANANGVGASYAKNILADSTVCYEGRIAAIKYFC
jgi:hypothetical protein